MNDGRPPSGLKHRPENYGSSPVRISSLLFVDDVVLLVSLNCNQAWNGRTQNQHLPVWGCGSHSETGGMRCTVGILGVHKWEKNRAGDRHVDQYVVHSGVDAVLVCCGEERCEPKGKTGEIVLFNCPGNTLMSSQRSCSSWLKRRRCASLIVMLLFPQMSLRRKHHMNINYFITSCSIQHFWGAVVLLHAGFHFQPTVGFCCCLCCWGCVTEIAAPSPPVCLQRT